MITRLHAMYQRSRKMLTSLVVIFLAINIVNGVITAISVRRISGEELILSGTYQCNINFEGDILLLVSMTSTLLMTVWEVLTLGLAASIAVKHLRELQRPSTEWITIGDCFAVLMKTHVVYFASFVAVSCFELGRLSPTISTETNSLIYLGVFQFFLLVQMVVLGPRLILSVREYHTKLVADSDAGTGMTSIVFQERVHVSTGSGV
ncbi:uncharacterized protein EDB91DRAFT_1350894 [Suillus paluster]|uniref:uncharacterized protein n=1 Tax=Suillus paluster TaxID=48578 RepID=UPI001B880AF7|nr:uncharacterized protein EDB91DRAFT_1350894 [Suillus paluster]KAG1725008.1 hypothetical protein EDB91DRAFT_1350894 [Suillus paluster]